MSNELRTVNCGRCAKRMTLCATSNNSDETVTNLLFMVSNCSSPSYLTPQSHGIVRNWNGDVRGHLTISCETSHNGRCPGSTNVEWVPFCSAATIYGHGLEGDHPSMVIFNGYLKSSMLQKDVCLSAHRIERSDPCFRMGCGGW